MKKMYIFQFIVQMEDRLLKKNQYNLTLTEKTYYSGIFANDQAAKYSSDS